MLAFAAEYPRDRACAFDNAVLHPARVEKHQGKRNIDVCSAGRSTRKIKGAKDEISSVRLSFAAPEALS